jgi:hypothetical protein
LRRSCVTESGLSLLRLASRSLATNRLGLIMASWSAMLWKRHHATAEVFRGALNA